MGRFYCVVKLGACSASVQFQDLQVSSSVHLEFYGSFLCTNYHLQHLTLHHLIVTSNLNCHTFFGPGVLIGSCRQLSFWPCPEMLQPLGWTLQICHDQCVLQSHKLLSQAGLHTSCANKVSFLDTANRCNKETCSCASSLCVLDFQAI